MKQTVISGIGISVFAAMLALAAASPAGAAETAADAALPQALSTSDLAELSGGASPTGIAITSQALTAANSGNSVNAASVVTGDVTLQTGAFNGFNGIGNFVFNTGNNNNLQGTLSVTILTPPVN